jgi:hypothetical protein
MWIHLIYFGQQTLEFKRLKYKEGFIVRIEPDYINEEYPNRHSYYSTHLKIDMNGDANIQ